LLNHLYDEYQVLTDHTIDSHTKNLRRKPEALDADQPFIRAVLSGVDNRRLPVKSPIRVVGGARSVGPAVAGALRHN
ncbi:hypothetical protein NL531_32970, partial [Klebsiella pneumoniae]|nr:hypothetical protein [Klebsiella pneumoniae]